MESKKYGYTLIEIIVSVVIVAIISIGVSQFNLAWILNLQRSSIFVNQVVSIIEVTRNYFMTGKYITTSQVPAYAWKVEFPIWVSSKLYVRYKLTSAGAWIEEPRAGYTMNNFEKIVYVSCKQIDNTSVNINTAGLSVNIVFEPGKIWFEWCPDNSYRKIEIVTNFRGITKKVLFNGMSGIIENVQ